RARQRRAACGGGPQRATDHVRAVSAALQYSTHFLVSFTASEPSGTLYSSSIEAGTSHLFFFTICRMSLIGVSPVPHARFSEQWSGVVRSFRWKLAMRSWYFSRDCIVVAPIFASAPQ